MSAPWRPPRPGRGDRGSAIIEFTFVAVLIMVPLVYLVVAVATVQRAQLAVTNAAREAGRAFATATTARQGLARAEVAVRIVLADAGLPDDATLRFVALGAGCDAATVTPALSAGSEYLVCVRRAATVPAVPTVVQGRGITTEGRFAVHVDDYRTRG
ncbi:MAG: pilus assembly protein [Actinomycetota bacterium]|nr:pilus assembly protein [Actinomycetota bacterium]